MVWYGWLAMIVCGILAFICLEHMDLPGFSDTTSKLARLTTWHGKLLRHANFSTLVVLDPGFFGLTWFMPWMKKSRPKPGNSPIFRPSLILGNHPWVRDRFTIVIVSWVVITYLRDVNFTYLYRGEITQLLSTSRTSQYHPWRANVSETCLFFGTNLQAKSVETHHHQIWRSIDVLFVKKLRSWVEWNGSQQRKKTTK